MPESLSHLPAIALTMGDPAGIGPEIVLKALADAEVAPLARWIVVGDARVLQMAEQSTGLKRAPSELRDGSARRSPRFALRPASTRDAARLRWSCNTSASQPKCASAASGGCDGHCTAE